MSITRIQPGKRMSAAVVHGNTVYLAGQVANDSSGSIEVQTAETLAIIDGLLAEAGTPSMMASVSAVCTSMLPLESFAT